MPHNEQPTTKQQLSNARQEWSYPVQDGNTEDALLLLNYTIRVCACAMRCDEMTDADRDAVYLLLRKSATLCDVVSLTT